MNEIVIQNEVIAASAGTGKTFNLAVRYIKLLIAGVKPETIVALTFSRKAAGEIFDRIIMLISSWISDRERFERESVSFGIPKGSWNALLPLLRTVLDNIHKLPIGTLDSFFVRIIQTFPFEFGLTGDFRVMEELMLKQAKEQVFKHILWNQSSDGDRDGFLEAFKQATFGEEKKQLYSLLEDFVRHNHTVYLESSGGGEWGNPAIIWPDGSTLMHVHVDAEKVADELLDVLKMDSDVPAQDVMPDFLEEVRGFTAHSQLTSRTAKYYDEKLLPAVDELYEGSCTIKKFRSRKNVHVFDPVQCEKLAKLLLHVLRCQIENALEKSQGVYRLMARYEQVYDSLFRRNGQLTFTDILHLLSPVSNSDANVLSTKVSDEDKLYIDYRLDSSYSHWMLDEFQDTSYSQWMVIKELIDEVMQDADKSFFYVGDTKQAIYGWRGGDASLFNHIYNDLDRRYGTINKRTLSESWRSGSQVISMVNHVFDGLKKGKVQNLDQSFADTWEWPEHKTNRPDINGFAQLIEIAPENGRSEEEKLDKRVGVIVDEIRRIEPFRRGLSVAVLVRSNNKGKAFSQKLEAQGIRTALEGSFSLTDSDVVRALVSFIRCISHPGDLFAWHHVSMTPLKMMFANRYQLVSWALPLVSNCGFEQVLRWLITKLEENGDVFNTFNRKRIEQLLNVAREFDTSGKKDCLDFVEFVEDYKLPPESAASAVQILTVHKSKGLEYDIVFMPELDERESITKTRHASVQLKKADDRSVEWGTMLPKRAVAEHEPVLADFVGDLDRASFYESMCVLYVGMTRAAKALYMFVNPEPKAKGKTIRSANIVRDSLYSGEAHPEFDYTEHGGECLYTDGTSDWFETYSFVEGASVGEVVEERPLIFENRSRMESTTPSGAEKRTVELAGIFDGSIGISMDLGTAVHSLFEQIVSIADCVPDDIAAQWLKDSSFPTDISNEAAKLFKKSLESEEIIAALCVDPQVEKVWIEKPFEVVVDGTWITGIFDRVTISYSSSGTPVSAIIYDYKTDGEESDEALIEMYKPQLDIYQRVLADLLSLESEKIEKKLIVVRCGQVIPVL